MPGGWPRASDASFGPGGERSHQGLLAVWAGGLIQWESKRQSFATLSSSEAEVTSYVDAMCLGDSVAVLVDIFEERRLSPSVVWRFPIRNPGSTQPKRAFEIKASQAGVESTARGSATGGMETEAHGWGGTGSRLPHKTQHCGNYVGEVQNLCGVLRHGRAWGPGELEEDRDLQGLGSEGFSGSCRVRKVESVCRRAEDGVCAVAAGICHVVQRWRHHLCCLKRKRTPREDEPGNSNGESVTPEALQDG